MHKNQILLKPGEVNFGSIHLRDIGIKIKTKSDQMVKKCYHHYIKTYCKICKHVSFPILEKKTTEKSNKSQAKPQILKKKL